jgi:hypothetical protein
MAARVPPRQAPERAADEKDEEQEPDGPLIEEDVERHVLDVPRQVNPLAHDEPARRAVGEIAVFDEIAPARPDEAHVVEIHAQALRLDRESKKGEAWRVPGSALQVTTVERYGIRLPGVSPHGDLGRRNRARSVVEEVLLADLDMQERGHRSAGIEGQRVRPRRNGHSLRNPEKLAEAEWMPRARQHEIGVALVRRDPIAPGKLCIGGAEEVAVRKSSQPLAQHPVGRRGEEAEPIAPVLDPPLEVLFRRRESLAHVGAAQHHRRRPCDDRSRREHDALFAKANRPARRRRSGSGNDCKHEQRDDDGHVPLRGIAAPVPGDVHGTESEPEKGPENGDALESGTIGQDVLESKPVADGKGNRVNEIRAFADDGSRGHANERQHDADNGCHRPLDQRGAAHHRRELKREGQHAKRCQQRPVSACTKNEKARKCDRCNGKPGLEQRCKARRRPAVPRSGPQQKEKRKGNRDGEVDAARKRRETRVAHEQRQARRRRRGRGRISSRRTHEGPHDEGNAEREIAVQRRTADVHLPEHPRRTVIAREIQEAGEGVPLPDYRHCGKARADREP